MKEEFIELDFDEKLKVKCKIIGMFDAIGKKYIALQPDDKTGELFFYGIKEKGNGEYELLDIVSNNEMKNVIETFQNIFIMD